MTLPSPEALSELPPAEALARQFHEAYERLAPSFGYETREASAKPWAEVPANNRALMIAVCGEILSASRQREHVLRKALEDIASVSDHFPISEAKRIAIRTLRATLPETGGRHDG